MGLLVASHGTWAQRADDNAVIAAQDAFGTTVGLQSVGLYSPNDARGFNPQQAGNLRIEGLYFDQQTFATSECLVRETTMRVGVAAQGYSFPAPTGIVDLSLRKPGDVPIFSTIATRGPFEAEGVELETQAPLGRSLSADLCVGFHRNIVHEMYHRSQNLQLAGVLRWQPSASLEIVPFWSQDIGSGRRVVPYMYTDGSTALAPFRSQDLAVFDWSRQGWREGNLGVVAKASPLGWRVDFGVFHSLGRDAASDQPYATLVSPGAADFVSDVIPPVTAQSTSGELRLARSWTRGPHRIDFRFSLRGRQVDRQFGGDALFDFGTFQLDHPMDQGRPLIGYSPQSKDAVRELDVGATVEERWFGVGTLAVGVLSDHYRREVDTPGLQSDITTTRPTLLRTRVQSDWSKSLVFYMSYVQGLEDSAPAPASAENRYEPPPAMRTWQIDGGIRWIPTEKLQLVLGAFEITKPYFNLNAANIYGLLGRVQHRGAETSISYSDAGVTFLAGGVFLKPQVERRLPEPGATGSVPLGPVPFTLTANIDLAPAQWGRWAGSLQWNYLSRRTDSLDNLQYLPALNTLSAGIRCHLGILSHPWTARLDAFNLTNARGLHVSNLSVVTPEEQRRYMLTVATDF